MPITRSTVTTSDILHLWGGVRAATRSDGHVVLFPTANGAQVELPPMDTRSYRTAFQRLGLDLVGHDEVYSVAHLQRAVWNLFDPAEASRGDARDVWSMIAYSAYGTGNAQASTVARDVAFSLLTSSMRLRDLSNQHHMQAAIRLAEGQQRAGRFRNLETLDLYMAIHSFFVEMCSARDYLARFIASNIYNVSIDSMAGLFRHLQRQPASHPLTNLILQICSRDRDEGWMARLGEFRDIVAHRAPISRFASDGWLEARLHQVEPQSLLTIYFGLPADPIRPNGTDFVDSLQCCYSQLMRMNEFARTVAQHSPYRPVRQQITEADIRE